MMALTSYSLDAPGATLHYDIRGDRSGTPLLMIGSPMAASGFGTLAGYFTDRTVVTYDPRGAERSPRTDDARATTPGEHADDLRRLITAVDAGPADIFASSGGAVNALVLVAKHPDLVGTLVAHEPPALEGLSDRDEAKATGRAIHETYLKSGFGPAMAKFIAMASVEGPLPAGYADQPAPDPATYGLPSEDDGSRDDPLLGQNMVSAGHHEHDLDAIRAASTRVVLAAGEESTDLLTGRTTYGLAERLGIAVTVFPGGHAGFLGGEYGMTGVPEQFAAKLRAVLANGS